MRPLPVQRNGGLRDFGGDEKMSEKSETSLRSDCFIIILPSFFLHLSLTGEQGGEERKERAAAQLSLLHS